MRVEEVRPNFWPLAIYNSSFPEEAHIDSVKDFMWKGKKLQGVYVPDDGKPLPPGVLKLSNFSNNSVLKSQTVERGDQQFGKDQAESTRLALLQRAQTTAKATVAPCESSFKRDTTMDIVIPDDSSEEERAARQRKKRKAQEDEDEDDEPCFDFDALLFGASAADSKSSKDIAKTKGKSKATPAATSPKKKKGRKATTPKRKAAKKDAGTARGSTPNVNKKDPKKPKESPTKSGGANIPDWRLRHNKQRKLQQLEQHMLLAKQALEMFTSSFANTSTDKLGRYVKVLAEMLEYDSSFMEFMKDESGCMVAQENLEKARSSVRMRMSISRDICSDCRASRSCVRCCLSCVRCSMHWFC